MVQDQFWVFSDNSENKDPKDMYIRNNSSLLINNNLFFFCISNFHITYQTQN